MVASDQVRLGPRHCLYLTFTGIYYRFTRALITVSIVALAVAFLTYIIVYNVVVEHEAESIALERSDDVYRSNLVERLGRVDERNRVIAAVQDGDESRILEYRNWGNLTESEYGHLRSLCLQIGDVEHFLSSVTDMSQAVLIGDMLPRDFVFYLEEDTAQRSVFVKQLRDLSIDVPMGSEFALNSFLNELPVLHDLIGRIRAGHRTACDAVRDAAGNVSVAEALSHGSPVFFDAVKSAGFCLTRSEFDVMSGKARVEREVRLLDMAIQLPHGRQAIARLLGIDPVRMDAPAVLRTLVHPAQATAIVESLNMHSGNPALTDTVLLRAAGEYRRVERLQQIIDSKIIPDVGEKRTSLLFVKLPQRSIWFIAVSFIVCAVGISNTMFMSVTERFTEIATMKCLGALDGSIMQMFLYEAIIQGMLGSLAGLLVGLMLALVRAATGLGFSVLEGIAMRGIVEALGFSLACGVFLAAISAVAPAWMATRLAPMEAMRIE